MKRLPVVAVTLVVLVALATALWLGLASRDDDTRRGMGPGVMAPGSSSAPRSWDDTRSSMMGQMMGQMMGPFGVVGESEYLTDMVAHHREAVAAARELARSERPQMRAFGESIVTTQTAQIELMTGWLEEWYPDTSGESDYHPMMRDLTGLTGDELDRTFLEDMITHHMIAVMSSQHLLWRGTDHDEVTELARSIRDEQHREIVEMQRWLRQWFSIDWRGPHPSDPSAARRLPTPWLPPPPETAQLTS